MLRRATCMRGQTAKLLFASVRQASQDRIQGSTRGPEGVGDLRRAQSSSKHEENHHMLEKAAQEDADEQPSPAQLQRAETWGEVCGWCTTANQGRVCQGLTTCRR